MTGIEKIKDALKVVINVGEAVDKALLDDGNINLFEGIGIATKAVKMWGVAKDFELIYDEYIDLDDTEKAELVDFFCDELELENEQTELIIESAFTLLLNIKDFLASFDAE